MFKCMTSSLFSMKADIYSVSSSTTNMKSGEVEKLWSLQGTIDCTAKGYVTKSSGTNSTEIATGTNIIITKEEVKLRSLLPISSTHRVANIRNSDGAVWYEENASSGIDGTTIFEVNGSTPLVDFDGKVIGFETILKRQDIQSLSLEVPDEG